MSSICFRHTSVYRNHKGAWFHDVILANPPTFVSLIHLKTVSSKPSFKSLVKVSKHLQDIVRLAKRERTRAECYDSSSEKTTWERVREVTRDAVKTVPVTQLEVQHKRMEGIDSMLCIKSSNHVEKIRKNRELYSNKSTQIFGNI